MQLLAWEQGYELQQDAEVSAELAAGSEGAGAWSSRNSLQQQQQLSRGQAAARNCRGKPRKRRLAPGKRLLRSNSRRAPFLPWREKPARNFSRAWRRFCRARRLHLSRRRCVDSGGTPSLAASTGSPRSLSPRPAASMMQIYDSYSQKHSLFNAMNRFIGAVNNMDQTVMVPSLLRDVPLLLEELDAGGGCAEREAPLAPNGGPYCSRRDMYSHYVLLKSIRNDIEWGVLQQAAEEAGGRKKEKLGGGAGSVDIGRGMAEDAEAEEDLEKQFHYHLSGLHSVLSKLTRKANVLTNRYKQEIGGNNWGH